MPMLNVNPVLSSPFLMDTFSIERATTTVVKGRNVSQLQRIDGITGVVHPLADKQERNEDGAYGRRTIRVYTQFRLQGQLAGANPDVIIWGGTRFKADSPDDFTHFSNGFVQVTAYSQDLQDSPAGSGT